MKADPSSLDALFWPRAVAIVGASAREHSIGHSLIDNLQRFGYRGLIRPVHPSAQQICGVEAYPNLAAIPGPVDLAHIVVAAAQVPQVMAECGAKGVKAVIINSAGFKEAGTEGERLQQAFLAEAQRHGIRVFGPNCQGIINTDPTLRAYCNFTNPLPAAGTVSLAALSGGVGALILQGLCDLGVGVRMYASNGNACDVSIPEILRYWAGDEGTQAIVLYTEGLGDARAFLDAATVAAARKPVLAMNAGRTERGAKAAASHTGALAGAGATTELVFRKAGILPFGDEGELIRAAMALSMQPVPRGPRVAVVTNAGGPAVIATDVLVECALEVPALADATARRLRAALLPQAAVENPVDVVATAGAEHFRAAFEALLDDADIDALLLCLVTPSFTDTAAIAREVVAASRQRRKPIVCAFMTDLVQERFRATQQILQSGGVPCYPYPGEAARALAAMDRCRRLRERPASPPRAFDDCDRDTARAIVDAARRAGRHQLAADEVMRLCECYRLPLAAWRCADDADAAAAAATQIGFPVVLKVDTAAASHKSDVGGVVLGLADAAAVRAEVLRLQDRLQHLGPLRWLVQRQLEGGVELIVGASSVDGLGHQVMFGLGGIHVEVLKDVVFALCPIGPAEARGMLDSIRGAALLRGVRGRPGVDRDALAELIERLSAMLSDLPAIAELDLNPVLGFADGVRAVDARITLAAQPACD